MEQKRVLWIVAAVGLFLLVVIGTALWISSPSNKSQPALNTLQYGGNAWSRNESQLQPIGSNVIIADASAGQNGITNIDFSNSGNGQAQAPVNLNNLDSSAATAPSATTESQAQAPAQTTQAVPASTDNRTSSAGLAQTAVTLNVNITPSSSNATAYNETSQQTSPTTTAPQTITVQPATVSATPAETKTTASAPAATNNAAASSANANNTKPAATSTSSGTSSKTTTTSTPASSTTQASVKTTASASNTVKAVPVIQPDQFWVQVASFTGKKNAEDARAALSEQKITGEVFTYQDAKGTIYYRLRVGPYKTKSEAEYWHTIIKEIDQFKGTDSYVVNSTVR